MLVFFDEGIAVLFGGGDDDGICAVLVDSTDENVSGLFCLLLSLKNVSCVGSFSGTVFDKGGDCGVTGGFEVLGDGYGVLHNWDGVSDLSFVEEAGCVLDKCGYLCVWRRIGRGIRLEDDDLGGGDGLDELDVVWEVEYRWEWYVWVVNLEECFELSEVRRGVIGEDGGEFLGDGEVGVVDGGDDVLEGEEEWRFLDVLGDVLVAVVL